MQEDEQIIIIDTVAQRKREREIGWEIEREMRNFARFLSPFCWCVAPQGRHTDWLEK